MGKKVTVFGAGVSGLTAAHELVIRGFDVTVIDPNINEFIEEGTFDRGIGGMARSQWGVDLGDAPEHEMQQLVSSEELQIDGRTSFVRNDPTTLASIERVRRLIQRAQKSGTKRPIMVHLCVDKMPPSKEAIGDRDYIVELLREGISSPERLVRLDPARTPAEVNTLAYTTVLPIMAGEHGFRFFPSFYRHVFDTMKRTPILKTKPSEDGRRTVYENLVPVEGLGFAREGARTSFLLPRRPVRTFEEFRRNMQKVFTELEWTVEDLSRFSLKLFEYMTSCTKRRKEQYETMSWSDFVGLDSYSPTMQWHIEFGPQMMLSLRGSRSDARTQGNTVAQLVLDQLREGTRPDATLAAPTSSAWFDHWYDFLRAQGAKFRRGELAALLRRGEKLVPMLADAAGTTLDDTEYVVVALPIEQVAAIAGKIDALGVLENRRDLVRAAAFLDPSGKDASWERPMRDMNGIQFYFDTEVRFWRGHTQYLDSEWGLTSISQPQFWSRERDKEDHYRSVLSVDIGIWDLPTEPDPKSPGKFGKGDKPVQAIQCDAPTLAREVWAQIADHHDEAFRAAYGADAVFPSPVAFALDSGLKLEPGDDPAGPPKRHNRYPFLVNMVGQYRTRPGELPEGAPKGASEYSVCGGVVLAGTHMQTYTRITSMEGANESARHAVNAILRHSKAACDRCEIWDPEENELPELQWLRDLDEKNFDRKLPHFAKILDLGELSAMLLPSMVGGVGGGNS